MNATIASYNLYCINVRCKNSVFNEIEETRIGFTEKNILEKHTCKACRRPLVSMMDIEIERTLFRAGIKLLQ